jgi:hypothetical protein
MLDKEAFDHQSAIAIIRVLNALSLRKISFECSQSPSISLCTSIFSHGIVTSSCSFITFSNGLSQVRKAVKSARADIDAGPLGPA